MYREEKNETTDQPKKTKLRLTDIVTMPNVAVKLSEPELAAFGQEVLQGYEDDLATRSEWEEKHAKALKVALQYAESKNFPWPGASNVKFPLVTVATLQFLARIGPLTSGRQLVKCEPWGTDTEGKKAARAERISQHMSFQLLEENPNWVDDDELAKFSAALLGSAIKKIYFDAISGTVKSQTVPLSNFVVDYYCKDLEEAQRVTQVHTMFHNEIKERVNSGVFLEEPGDYDARQAAGTSYNGQLAAASEDVSGIRKAGMSSLAAVEILEQHTWLDLDGDGYREPYIVFANKASGFVYRIVARYYNQGDVFRKNAVAIRELEDVMRAEESPQVQANLANSIRELEKAKDNTIIRIKATSYFTKYTFIPSPDNGFYGLGFGILLGPTNAAVDSLINQIIDAGTMLTTSGGFLGRGVKIKSGSQTFAPFEWKPVDSQGDDLRKSIVPLPVSQPPEIMFHLLGMLISYGEKIGSATDVMTGVNPGQNTPAETSRNTLEQGMMLFSGIYRRMYRGFAKELRKLYHMNYLYIKQFAEYTHLTDGESAMIAPDDYDTNAYRIYPNADPISASPAQRQSKARIAFDIMAANPNGFDRYKVVKRLLESYEISEIDDIFPDPTGPKAIQPILNPKIELEKAKLEQKSKIHEDEMQLSVAQLRQDMGLADAKILELEAKARKHLAEAEGVATGHQIALVNAQIFAAKSQREGLVKVLDVLERNHSTERKLKESAGTNGKSDNGSGLAGMANPPSNQTVLK